MDRDYNFNVGPETATLPTAGTPTDPADIVTKAYVDALALVAPAWVKYTVPYTSLQTAGLTNNITLFTQAAKELIHGIVMKHSTAFSGGAISAVELSVGIAGELDKYSGAFDVFQAVGNAVKQVTNVLDYESHGSTTAIKIAAVSVGANLSALAAGSVDVWVLKSVLP